MFRCFFVWLKCLFQGWMKRRWRNGETQRIFFKSFRELRIFWLITSHSSCLSAKLTCLRLGGDSWVAADTAVHLLSVIPTLDPRTQIIARRDNPQPLDTAVEVQNIDILYSFEKWFSLPSQLFTGLFIPILYTLYR